MLENHKRMNRRLSQIKECMRAKSWTQSSTPTGGVRNKDEIFKLKEVMLLSALDPELDIFNFRHNDVDLAVQRLERDLYFLKQNDITNYHMQVIVELNTLGLNPNSEQLSPNSFVSYDGRFLYHMGLSQFTDCYG